MEQSSLKGLPQVGEEYNRELDTPLSTEELTAALHGLAGGKAPSIDGIPAVLQAFWPVLGENLLCVLRDTLSQDRLTLSCRRAVLTLLPKKGDLQDIRNWRQVSLLCTDYELLTRVLATRLRKMMKGPDVLCAQQVNFWQHCLNLRHFGPFWFIGS